MSDFFLLLQFMWLPITITLLLALVLPIAGGIHTVRSELLLLFALPTVTAFVVSLGSLIPVLQNSSTALIALSAVVVVLLYTLLMRTSASYVERQSLLAVLFIGFQIATHLLVALNPSIGYNVAESLKGELLAVSMHELWFVAAVVVLLAAATIAFFPTIRLYVIDPQELKRISPHFFVTELALRSAVVLLVVITVITVGPLLATASMIIPAYFANIHKGSFATYLIGGTIIGTLSVLLGFSLALVTDLPPAYVVSMAFIVVGQLYQLRRIG